MTLVIVNDFSHQTGGLKSTSLKMTNTRNDVGGGIAMVEFAPQAITNLFNTVNDRMPSALMGGIIGDQAHTYGYHRGRNYVGGNDYSVQTPPDKKGNGEAACGLDISWNKAEDHYTASKRLLNAKNDSRMDVVREFYGSTDGRTVCGWDYWGNYAVTSDDSHLWHIHLSILRQYSENNDALQKVADVITGKSSSGGSTDGQEDGDMPKRFQAKRIDPLRVNQANTPWEIKWDQQDWDTGNVFFGTGKPEGDEAGRYINTGGADGASYVSTFSCVVKGLPEGQTFLAGLAFVDIKSGDTVGGSGWLECQGSGGNLEVVDTRVGYSNPDRGLAVRVQSPVAVDIVNAVWSVIHWPN